MKDKNTPSVSLVRKEFDVLSKVRSDFSDEQKQFILKTIAPSLDANELVLFLYRSQKLGLNPLEGEIYAYVSYEMIQEAKHRKLVMIVSRDGKKRLAAKTGHLKSIQTKAIYVKNSSRLVETGRAEATEVNEVVRVMPWEGGKLWGAECEITRDDYDTPLSVVVPLAEYTKNKALWKFKPETMIKKVAESQCLSYAFPELAGVYDESERFDDTPADKILVVSGGENSATNEQLATIKALGGDTAQQLNKQEAAELILSLSKK